MSTLKEDLTTPQYTLQGFKELTDRVSTYRNDMVSGDYTDTRGYRIQHSQTAGTKKFLRPVRISLFIWEKKEFNNKYDLFLSTLREIKTGRREFDSDSMMNIDRVVYTIQQSIGLGMDLLLHPNSARKHVGNRFEELLRIIISEIGLTNKKMVFKVPYTAGGKKEFYKSETDIIVSGDGEVKSTNKNLDSSELIISVKTTSKDRMGKMFLDKLLLKKLFNLPNVKVVGIFLNDVQRKESDKVSFTIVPGQFIVFSTYLEKMEGVFYLDTPANINKSPFTEMISPFSDFITNKIWQII